MKLEVVVVPVSDVDRAKRFIRRWVGGLMPTSPAAWGVGLITPTVGAYSKWAVRGTTHARDPAGIDGPGDEVRRVGIVRSDDQPRVHHISSAWHLVSSKRGPHPSRC